MNEIYLPKIEILENHYPNAHYIVKCEFPEFTTLCPKTGLPDFATIKIMYEPDQKLIELKSLKLYLTGYRNLKLSHEDFTNRILENLSQAVDPRWIYIEAKVNVRGGIYTTVSRFWGKEQGDSIIKTIQLLEGRLM